MFNKITMIESPPKATTVEKEFGASLSAMDKEALIAPGSKVLFGDGDLACTRVEKDGYYLQYELESPYAVGAGSTLAALSLDATKEKRDFDNYKVEVGVNDFRLKADYTLKSMPDSNQIVISIDTNLNPIFYMGDAEEGYELLYWSPTLERKDSIYMWDKIHIYDSNGNYTQGKYIGLDDKDNVIIEIDQPWLNNAVFPVVVDPTTQQIVASLPDADTIQCGKWANYNGSRYVAFFDTGAGGSPVIMTTTDLTTSSSDEFSNSPFTSADANKTAVVNFSNGDQLFFGQAGTTIYCATWTAAGSWDGARTTVATGVDAQHTRYNFDVTVDESENVYVIYYSGGFAMVKSTNQGTNWANTTAPGQGTANTRGAIALSADGNGSVHFFHHPGVASSNNPAVITYSISGNSWSGYGNIGSSSIIWRNSKIWRAQYLSNGKIFISFDDNGNMEFSSNNSGSWVSENTTPGSANPGYGLPLVDSDDNVYWVPPSGSVIYDWDEGDATTLDINANSPWWSGYEVYAGPVSSPVVALQHGEAAWCVGSDGSTETVWMENTDLVFIGGNGNGGAYNKTLISGTMTRDAKTTPLSNTFTEV
jgi:hypothetical protein